MSTESSNPLSQKAQTLVTVLHEAHRALETRKPDPSAPQPPHEAPELEVLRALQRRGTRLQRALGRRQALGIFGPSQAGKSFLVGALLAQEAGSLAVKGRTVTLDFLGEVNPAKGVESTGVVTRFTAQHQPLVAGEFSCELLSLEALLASFATGFLSECTAPPPDPGRIERALTRARSEGGEAASPLLAQAWSYAFAELCKKYQDRHPYVAELRRAAGLADPDGIASVRGYLALYSLLWGGIDYAPDLDALFALLYAGLAQVGFVDRVELAAEDIRAESAGHSVIDAACLNAIGQPAAEVTVHSSQGRPLRLAPSVLAALIAELRLPLEAPADSLLGRADLLDFPGGRALKGLSGFRPEELKSGRFDAAIEVLKRGKLTTLFEDFTKSREITALLLCSPGPTKPEAVQMQGQVEDWLRLRHGGAMPKSEAEIREPSLFIALTKFDMSLGALRSDNAQDRWDSRVQEACVEFWARNVDSWMHNWGRHGQSFDNMYWIRNPFADQMQTLAPGHADYETVKAGYFASRAVARHVRDAAAKWAAVEGTDAESGLPQSGVGLLTQSLRAKLRHDMKSEELGLELGQLTSEAQQLLASLVPSADVASERERRLRLADSLADALQRAVSSRASGLPFGQFAQAVVLPYDAVLGEVRRALAQVLPLSVRGSDKVKRLLLHVLKWWQREATARLRQSEVQLPHAAVELYLREVLFSKSLVPRLGSLLLPIFGRNVVDDEAVARILHVVTSDCMFHLFRDGARRTPEPPVRLSFSEQGGDHGHDAVDWSLDFDAEPDSGSDVYFAGKPRLDHFRSHVADLYLDGLGEHGQRGPQDPAIETLARLARELV